MKLFDKNGYFNIESVIDFALQNEVYFIFITGARGTGKTYGALKYALKKKKTFLFVRRKQTQVDEMCVEIKSPFAPLNKDLKKHIVMDKISKSNYAFYNGVWSDEKETYIPNGEAIGFTACATTSANSRGFNGEAVELIIYDEFIPEPTEKRIKGEAVSTLNLFETVIRNRELKGEKPPITLLLANSMMIDNALFNYLNLVDEMDDMELKHHSFRLLKDRSVLLIRLEGSPVSKKKKETALYKMASGTDFVGMAIENEFVFNQKGKIKRFPLTEFKPLVCVGEITILQHKAQPFYYVVRKKLKCKNTYDESDIDLIRFKIEQAAIWTEYIFQCVYFDRYATQLKFQDYFSA